MDEASDRVTRVMLIHTDGFGVQMPFSALSLSQETGRPLPSHLSRQPSLMYGACDSVDFSFFT